MGEYGLMRETRKLITNQYRKYAQLCKFGNIKCNVPTMYQIRKLKIRSPKIYKTPYD